MTRLLALFSIVTLASLTLAALTVADPAFAAAVGTTTTTTVAANPSTTTTVSLTPFYTYLNEFVSLFLSALAAVVVGWVMFLFNKYIAPHLPAQFRAMLDAQASTALNKALANGAPIVMQQLGAFETVHTDVNVKNAVVAGMVNNALKFAPEAVARFGLTPADLAVKALAFIPSPPPTTPQSGSTDQVQHLAPAPSSLGKI